MTDGQRNRQLPPAFWGGLVLLGLFIALPAGYFIVRIFPSHPELARISLGKGRFAIIAESRDMDTDYQRPAIALRVLEADGRDVFGWSYIGSVEGRTREEAEKRLSQLRFAAVSAAGGDVIGIIEMRHPNILVDLFDFRSRQEWMRNVSDIAWKEARLHELEAANPGRFFEIGSVAWPQ